jgi:hypothetical protein
MNPEPSDRNSLLFGALNLPSCTVGVARISANEDNHPVAAADFCATVGFPGEVPRLFNRHVDKIEGNAPLIPCLKDEIIACEFVFNCERDEDSLPSGHVFPSRGDLYSLVSCQAPVITTRWREPARFAAQGRVIHGGSVQRVYEMNATESLQLLEFEDVFCNR